MTQPSEDIPGVYLVLVSSVHWECFIPEEEFEKYFIIVDRDEEQSGTVIIKESEFSGYFNSDTYLQSYCLQHVRSCVRPGKWNVRLLGVYNLDDG